MTMQRIAAIAMGNPHVERRFASANAAVVGEEGEVGNLDAGMVEDAGGRRRAAEIQTIQWPSAAAALITIDLLTKPEKSGKAEIDAAPTMQSPVVWGIDL